MATLTHRRTRTAARARQEKLEQLLSLQGAALRTRKQLLRDSQPAAGVDVEETSLDAEERGLGLSLLEITSQTVRRIETALQRLEAGELGTCSDCGGDIGEARLQALPFAALCLACQEKRDVAEGASANQATAVWKDALRRRPSGLVANESGRGSLE
jgi:RNA polymerase-binding transcription factor DksA